MNNAFDALKEGTPKPRLVVRTSIAGDKAQIVFADNGPGMKNPKQVFEHFYTTKPVGQGTGAEPQHLLRGRPAARRPDQRGKRRRGRSTIHDRAAAGADAGDPEGSPDRGCRRAGAAASGSFAGSVLVVDDEPTLVDLQKDILEALGAVVVRVSSGREAIEHLQRRTFDLIVTDMRMPGDLGPGSFPLGRITCPGIHERFRLRDRRQRRRRLPGLRRPRGGAMRHEAVLDGRVRQDDAGDDR